MSIEFNVPLAKIDQKRGKCVVDEEDLEVSVVDQPPQTTREPL